MNNKWQPFTDTEKQYLTENYSKIGATHCAINLGRSRNCIQQNAKLLNLSLDRGQICRYVFQKEYEDFSVNPRPFIESNCMTPLHAYLLGFIWADGNLSKNGYTTSACFVETDSEDLLPIFQKTGKWSIYKNKPKTKREGKPHYALNTSNKPLLEYLASKGYYAKSTQSANQILDVIPQNLHRYWWLGCIDGDGCFHISKKGQEISIHSSYTQDWKYFEDMAKTNHIDFLTERRILKKTGAKSSCMRIVKKQSCTNFIRFLYPNGYEMGLKRKYEKAKEMLERCEHTHIICPHCNGDIYIHK
jgi:hypothetical protein